MAASKRYLVAVDFSKSSEAALDQAIKMARDSEARLFLVHVISATFAFPLEVGFADIFEVMENDAKAQMKGLIRSKRLKPGQYRPMVIRAADTALAIANLARKLRATMIVMGSHGRTGLQRLMLGSVAEKIVRSATCPVFTVRAGAEMAH